MKAGRSARPRIRHLARFVDEWGNVSPWCAKKPRALDMKKAIWTNRLDAVTCKRCRDAKAAAS